EGLAFIHLFDSLFFESFKVKLLCCVHFLTDNQVYENLNLTQFNLHPQLDQSIKLKTAEIRKSHKIKLPDAIIAASALAFDLTLITRNVADFRNIDGLTLLNPFDL
ncbi:MAG: PIN domain-containing protein, partial [Sphingobacteriaceae bacterium]|nr:PIN domain-containing protein [Sphingobacteriaceae bacterium]